VKLSKEFKIGVVVVCAVSAFVWGISFLKGSNLFSNKYYLYAVYNKIDNLIPANPLQINGFKIGQIKKISLIENGRDNKILVKFVLTEDVNIPKGSIARAVSTDLLGNKAVEVIFSNSKEFVKNGDTLKAESEISLKESFNKQIAPLQVKAESLIGNIDSVMTVVSLVLNTRTRENIERSFESVRKAILSLEQTAYKLDALMASEKPKLSGILTNLNNITNNLSKNEQKINNILTNFSAMSDSLAHSQLKSAVANADKDLAELKEILTRINEGKGTLGKLAKNDSLYNNMNRSAEDLDKLLKDLRINPHRYVHISVFGRKNKSQPLD
jgi:phospholipid/cholesterol/gamma-HCH transport system substrate-binding protein